MDGFWSYWYSLSQGLREGIVAGIVSTVAATAILKLSGVSIGAAFRRITGRATPPALPPASIPAPPSPQEFTFKFEGLQQLQPGHVASQPLPAPHSLQPESVASTSTIPRAPAIEFVPRRDKAGRDILAQLKEKLAPGNHQLIVLWGPGGVGKTRLANEATRALEEAFAGRIIWVSADGLTNFSLSTLLDAVATQLDRAELRQLAPEPKKEQVRDLIAAALPLIVLDNFETIAPEEQNHCAAFLAQDASCPALITTRAMIVSTFAHNIPIDAMAPDEAQKFLDEWIAQCPDAEAFTETNRQRIIETSAANPLVMQWIVQQIILAQEPQAVLDKLSQGEGDAAQRVFDNSFNLPHVGDDGRAALLALSLFTPSASRPALAEVAGFGNDIERLNRGATALAALRLARTTAQGKRLLIEGLTRELAKARLSKDGRASEFRQRFVAHFLNYAEAHAQRTPEDYDVLEVEKDSLLSAIDISFDLQDWHRVVRLVYAVAFPGLLDTRGYWDESIRVGEQALKAARHLHNEKCTADFVHNIAVIHQRQGRLTEARRLYNESLEINKKLGNQSGIAGTLHELGLLAQIQGELTEARRLYNESLEIAKKLGDQNGIAITLHQLGRLAQIQGELSEARRLYNESLEINKKLGNQSGIAGTTSQIGIVLSEQGKRDESKIKHEESLAIRRKIGDKQGISIDLHQLAMIAQIQGELPEARRLYNESLEIAKKLGDQNGIAITLYNLGLLAEGEGNREEAVRLLREALGIFEKLKSPDAETVRRNLKKLGQKAP
jgi:tetratricopeptide (TPR) repeat protein